MKKFLDMPFYKKVLIIAAPVMLQNFISAFAQLIDNLMVGSLGSEAIAAVSASNSIFFVVMMLMFGVSEATSIYIAQYHGAQIKLKQKQAFIIGIFITVILTLIAVLIISTFSGFLLSLYLTNEQTIIIGQQYLSIVLISYVFIAINISIGSGFRAIGHAKYAMYGGIISIIVNTILNYCLITGFSIFPELGVSGAAIATVIARIVETSLLVVIMLRVRAPFAPTIKAYKSITRDLVQSISIKALPLTINEFGYGLGTAFIMTQYGFGSETNFTAVSIAYTTGNLFFVVMSGFGVAASILIGHQLGEGNLKLAKLNADKLIFMSVVLGIIITLIYTTISFLVPHLYNVTDDIKLLAQTIMQIQALYFIFYLTCATCFFIMRAGGDSLSVLIFDGGCMFLLAVPVSYYLAQHTDFSLERRFLIIQSIDIFKMALGIFFIRKGRWINNLTVGE